MTKVFIGGSRRVTRLNADVQRVSTGSSSRASPSSWAMPMAPTRRFRRISAAGDTIRLMSSVPVVTAETMSGTGR